MHEYSGKPDSPPINWRPVFWLLLSFIGAGIIVHNFWYFEPTELANPTFKVGQMVETVVGQYSGQITRISHCTSTNCVYFIRVAVDKGVYISTSVQGFEVIAK